MRVGIVSPYAWDVPGGVQFHIRDLAEELNARGHTARVLAPSESEDGLPAYVTSAGKSVPIRFNGSVARLSFGPTAVLAVNRWLAEGAFDLVHVHEPISPSLGMIAMTRAEIPVVATFHASQDHSHAAALASVLLDGVLDKVTARIAVSREAERTALDHYSGDYFIIPNGVRLASFRGVAPVPRWAGARHGGRPTVAFLGRLDEPRKGLPVFAEAALRLAAEGTDVRFLIAGRGEAEEARALLAPLGERAVFLGEISDADKAALFSSVDVYVAPQLGGESFGIVLVEAMAAGACVVASDIPAFQAVLDDGRAGSLFTTGDPASLALAVQAALDGTGSRRTHAAEWIERYDWGPVTDTILEVYRGVISVRDAPATKERLTWRERIGLGRKRR